MKKIVILMLLIAVFALPVNAFAASQKQINEIKLEIKAEQKVYTNYSSLAGELLAQIINGGLSLEEKAELRLQLKDARKKFMESADKMLKLRIELYELTN